jgi:hypothetical protein
VGDKDDRARDELITLVEAIGFYDGLSFVLSVVRSTQPLKKISPVRTLPVFVTAQSLQIYRHHVRLRTAEPDRPTVPVILPPAGCGSNGTAEMREDRLFPHPFPPRSR